MSTRGQLAVRFAHDPPGYRRLILAQAGRHFMVGREPNDPPGDVPGGPMFWFRWEDPKLGAELAGLYFSRDDLWAEEYRPAQTPVPVANGAPEEGWNG